MRRLATVVLLVTGTTVGPLALSASAEMPERVRWHVETNHAGGASPSGNDRASSGPGTELGRYTKCFLFVTNPEGPSCYPPPDWQPRSLAARP
jgi:hypothetical protein